MQVRWPYLHYPAYATSITHLTLPPLPTLPYLHYPPYLTSITQLTYILPPLPTLPYLRYPAYLYLTSITHLTLPPLPSLPISYLHYPPYLTSVTQLTYILPPLPTLPYLRYPAYLYLTQLQLTCIPLYLATSVTQLTYILPPLPSFSLPNYPLYLATSITHLYYTWTTNLTPLPSLPCFYPLYLPYFDYLPATPRRTLIQANDNISRKCSSALYKYSTAWVSDLSTTNMLLALFLLTTQVDLVYTTLIYTTLIIIDSRGGCKAGSGCWCTCGRHQFSGSWSQDTCPSSKQPTLSLQYNTRIHF